MLYLCILNIVNKSSLNWEINDFKRQQPYDTRIESRKDMIILIQAEIKDIFKQSPFFWNTCYLLASRGRKLPRSPRGPSGQGSRWWSDPPPPLPCSWRGCPACLSYNRSVHRSSWRRCRKRTHKSHWIHVSSTFFRRMPDIVSFKKRIWLDWQDLRLTSHLTVQ